MVENRWRFCCGALLVSLVVFAPDLAAASPWVLEEDELVVSGRFDFQQADREFLDSGGARDFPLNGRYRSATFNLGARLGLVDNLELGLNLPLRLVSYQADPVILIPCGDQNLDCYQENIISFSRTASGLADIRTSVRYQFMEGRFAASTGVYLKTPTGYDRPAGTFGRNPQSAEDFENNAQTYATPGNVQDDVTLGDGQVDLSALALFGWSLPTRTFLRLDGGYNLRFGGAGDQILARFKVGQALGRRVLIYAGSDFAYAVEEGQVIGVSVSAEDPTLPAEEYGGLSNLELREIELSRDRLSALAGILFRVTGEVELNVGYRRILWGRNVALAQTVSMGLSSKFDISGDG